MINLAVTGMLRSGTTLLEKALNSHPDIKIAYQPFPELFIHTKKLFFKHLDHPPPYHVLSHYCRQSIYTPADFTAWLDKAQPSQPLLADGLSADNQKLIAKPSPPEASLANWYAYLIRKKHSPSNMLCLGSKEVLIEEYVPHLLNNDIFGVIIIRDPRDVITSLDYGRGKKYTGSHRPTLFNLRNWRKSVNFALALDGHRNFCMIRFEDLVRQPVATLNKIARMMGLQTFDKKWWSNGFQSENGTLWKGNSSFGEIKPFNPASIGGHADKLSKTTRLYIESVCRREMLAMDYAVSPSSLSACKKSISGFKDPFAIKRTEFQPNYSHTPKNIEYEIKRLENPDPGFFLFHHIAEKMMRIQLW